jgi:lipid-binding SYLF domain-containing protein
MKSPIHLLASLTVTLFGLALPAVADAGRAELDQRLRTLTTKFVTMQDHAEKRIPREKLQKAHGILLLDRTKAGFVFAYQGGHGVAMVKDAKTGKWSAPSFVKADEASLGVQIGVQQSFIVALFMDAEAAKRLAESQTTLGGEARGTAGNESTGTEATTDSESLSVLVYSDREGLYGGAAVKGGNVEPDSNANVRYYGQAVTAREILFENKVKPTEAALELAGKVQAQTKGEKK